MQRQQQWGDADARTTGTAHRYMLLLIWVIMMQGGSSVKERYNLVHAISEHLNTLRTLECAATVDQSARPSVLSVWQVCMHGP